MKYQDLQKNLGSFIVFSLNDIKKIEPNFHRPQLNFWQKKNYIKKLRRGFYMFSETALNEDTLFIIANRLYSPSYVSLESALSYYGLIPEGVYSITSISTKKTANFKTPVADFSYRRVKTSLHFGYQLKKQNGQSYKIADMEKAILDYLYLHPKIVDAADFYEWRFNAGEFMAKADLKKLNNYAKVFGSRALLKRLKKLLQLLQVEKYHA